MFSIVIPVYGNEGTLLLLIEELEGLAEKLRDKLEVVFIVDGSPDRSFELLQERLLHVSFACQLILLSRNFGAFAGIRQGLEVAKGPNFAVMAADLQEPPELILEFDTALAVGDVDVVLGERVGRNDPWATRISANLFWWFYCRFIQHEMQPGGVDVFACNQSVRNVLIRMEEAHSSLVGQLIWLGFRRKSIPYVRKQRSVGKSAWTFRKKWNYMLNSIFSFTALPIALLGFVGCVGVISSCAVGIFVFFSWYAGAIEVPGYTPIILLLLLSSSAHLIGLSIVGGYVWRTYENSKRRPQSIILRQLTFSERSLKEASIENIHPSKRDL